MVDMRGHGGSDNVSGEFTHRLAALDLLGLIDALAGQGVSRCGQAVLESALKHHQDH